MFRFFKYSIAKRQLKRGKRNAPMKLARIGGRRATKLLIAALGDQQRDISSEAYAALTSMGTSVLAPILEQFTLASSPAKCHMVHILARMPHDEVISPLSTIFMTESDGRVVETAGNCLAHFHGTSAAPLLIQSKERYRQLNIGYGAWIHALGQTKHSSVCPLLKEVLFECNWDLKIKAIQALACTGKHQAVTPLATAYGKAKQWAVDEHSKIGAATYAGELKHQILMALRVIASPKAVAVAIAALQDDHLSCRWEAVQILKEIGGKAAVAALNKALSDKSDWICCYAAEALQSLGATIHNDESRVRRAVANGNVDDVLLLGERAIEPLISLFQGWHPQHGTEKQLVTVAFLFGRLQATSAAPMLARALCDYDPMKRGSILRFNDNVIASIAKALGQIGGQVAIEALRQCQFPFPGNAQLEGGIALFQYDDPKGFEYILDVAANGNVAQSRAITTLVELILQSSDKLSVENLVSASRLRIVPDDYDRFGHVRTHMSHPSAVWRAATDVLMRRAN